jgi:hypothetical protein
MSTSEPVNIKDFGAVGNCTGWGIGADDTAAIQAAVNFAMATGRRIFAPVGGYRITSPINFSGTVCKVDFEGESILQTIFWADFTSATHRAAFCLDNPFGNRAYVAFRNFKMIGRADPYTSGIFCGWSGSFTELENVYVYNFKHGIVIAHDFNLKIVRCYGMHCLGNGLQIGFHLNGTSSPCNNVGIYGGMYAENGLCGIAVTECRSLGMSHLSSEANHGHNIYLDKIYGGSLTAVYMEFDPNLLPVQISQLYMMNSEGVSINGVSISAFVIAGGHLIWLAGGNKDITITGLCVESSATAPLTATAIRVDDSQCVKIRGSFKGIDRAVTVDATSSVDLDGPVFTGVAVPVTAADYSGCVLRWSMAKGADVDASVIGAACDRRIDRIGAPAPSAPVALATSEFESFTMEVYASDLNGTSGYSKILVPSALSGGQWRIVEILGVTITKFEGGDRGIAISDGTHIWSIIPNSAISVGTFQARWGSAQIPFSSTLSDMTQVTALGSNLVACATGGTCYHTAGFIKLTVVAHRVS